MSIDGRGRLPFSASRAAKKLSAIDPAMARLIESVGPCKLRRQDTKSTFEALTRSIVYQQLSGAAAATILARTHALFAGGDPESGRFIQPEDIVGASDAQLRSAGLSRPKIRALRDLAEKTLARTLPTLEEMIELHDDQIVDRLTSVHGIGRWSVEMLLIFRLGRPDVLPGSDYGIRKGFARAFKKRELPSVEQVMRRGERWRPHRTVASWYLWRANEL
jgi:3-methyladenine DNA glycosylase/8-oxoguanine DNA glycosylase